MTEEYISLTKFFYNFREIEDVKNTFEAETERELF